MIIAAAFRESNPRLGILAGIVGGGLLLLLLALFRLQVVYGAEYGDREQAQSLRRIRIPSARGEILDRNGIVLANNRPSYDVVIQLDQLRSSKRQDIWKVASSNLALLAQATGLPVTLKESDIRNHYKRRRPLPLTVWSDLTREQVASVAERVNNLPAVDLVAMPVRQYPQGGLAAHVLGYVGKAEVSEEEEAEEYYYYMADTAGKQGIEKAFDECLRGAPGGRSIRVNPGGRTVGEAGFKSAERGDRVVLTLDARVQKIVEEAMERAPLSAGKELRGAAVVLDARSGAVLAMTSAPLFDPNLFSPGVPAEQVNAVLVNPASPMFNRAISARYAPGSTFKPITTLAALESGVVKTTDAVDCTGHQQIGNRSFGCWNRRGHGRVDAAAALRWSCDVWFYQRGMATKAEPIAAMAREFGLGQKLGFDLEGEKPGLVPTPDWKRARMGERWWDGDTAQFAMGQSFLLATPLQMANAAATLASGGVVWRPYIVQRIETPDGTVVSETKPEVRRRLRVSSENMEFVRQAMLAVVQAPDGTGRAAAVLGVQVAGKTGTAEVDVRVDGQTRRIKRTWFIAFAPFENPQVALAVMFEDGDSGGHTAAPVAGRILAGIFKSKVEGGGAALAD